MKLTYTLIRTLMCIFILLPGLVFSTPKSETSNDKKSLYSESNISIDVGEMENSLKNTSDMKNFNIGYDDGKSHKG